MRRFQAIGATALAIAAIGAHAEAPYSFDKTPGKLPKDVIPVEYQAHLAPDIAANTFSGTETVEIEVLKPTRPSC
jgi:puromycin-sensitive aminopeptidase